MHNYRHGLVDRLLLVYSVYKNCIVSPALGRGSLTSADYVDAALELIDQRGVNAFSMRRVAEHMGLSPMAAYRHFTNRDALLIAALDEFIARADVVPEGELPWDDWIAAVARAMRDALVSHPGWLPMIGSLELGRQAGIVTKAFIDRLTQAGFQPEVALRAWFAVIQLVIGTVCLGGPVGSREKSGTGGLAGAVAEAVGEPLRALRGVEQLELSLPLLLEGLRVLADQRPATRTPRTASTKLARRSKKGGR